jgi:hypothetical protein
MASAHQPLKPHYVGHAFFGCSDEQVQEFSDILTKCPATCQASKLGCAALQGQQKLHLAMAVMLIHCFVLAASCPMLVFQTQDHTGCAHMTDCSCARRAATTSSLPTALRVLLMGGAAHTL